MTERVSGPIAPVGRRPVADVVIVGDGVVALSTAIAVARAGGTSCIVGQRASGSASTAAAGLLAPSVGASAPAVRRLKCTARDRYPGLVHWLAERTGIDVPLNRGGIIELDAALEGGHERAGSNEEGSRWLEAGVLRSLEPALARANGALLHPTDGFVDNLRLLEAMWEAVRCEWGIDVVEARAARVEGRSSGWDAIAEDGRRYQGTTLVIAAGAWSPLIVDLPRALRIVPARGQMLELRGAPLHHAVCSADGYLLPRGEHTLVGSTFEHVGFDHRTTKSSIERLHANAATMVPELAGAEIVRSWAGLRPMTPDGLPYLGRDPEHDSLIYACGHGKNGILLAPLTGECVAALAAGSSPPVALDAFAPGRFD